MSTFIRTVRAHVSETVEIQWQLDDGTVHVERFTVPLKVVREAREKAQGDRKDYHHGY